ncbi:hypothetical protein ABK040_006116 [Willaertia magna]
MYVNEFNNETKRIDGIAIINYQHEKRTLTWDIFYKNQTHTFNKEILLRLVHEDFDPSSHNVTNYELITLGNSFTGSINETSEILNVPSLFDNQYTLELLVKETKEEQLLDSNHLFSTLSQKQDNEDNYKLISKGIVDNTCGKKSPVAVFDIKNWKMWIVLFVVIGVLISLVLDIFRPYFIAFTALAIFTVLQIISVEQALAGFSNEGLITIALLFPIVYPLSNNPVLLKVSKVMFGKPTFLPITLIRICIPISLLSMFLNNTPIVVAFIPLIQDWAKSHNISSSKFLIPLSYTTIAGGLCTLIGTSTNLVASGILQSYGYPEFGFFEFIYIGGILLVVETVYMSVIGVWLLPNHKGNAFSATKERGELFLSQLWLNEGKSPLIGKNKKKAIKHLGLGSLEIIEIIRTKSLDSEVVEEHIIPVPDDVIIQLDDKIVFRGLPEDIMKLHSFTGVASRISGSSDIASLVGSSSKNVEEDNDDIDMEDVMISTDNNNNNQMESSLVSFKKVSILDRIKNKFKKQDDISNNVLLTSPNSEEKNYGSVEKTKSEKKASKSVDVEFFEVVVGSANNCVGADYHTFEKMFQCVVLAVRQKETVLNSNAEAKHHFDNLSVQAGDTLLLISKADFYSKWRETNDFYIISRGDVDPKKDTRNFILKVFGKEYNLWWWEYLIFPVFVAMIACATAGIDMIYCTLVTFCVCVILRFISPSKAVQTIEWELLILVGSSLGIGLAVRESGVAEAFALLIKAANIPIILLPAIMFLITQVCTTVITNNAAASINLPIAIAIAETSGLNVRAMAMVVTIAATSDFSTPIGYQTNLLIQSPDTKKQIIMIGGNYQTKQKILLTVYTTGEILGTTNFVLLLVSSLLFLYNSIQTNVPSQGNDFLYVWPVIVFLFTMIFLFALIKLGIILIFSKKSKNLNNTVVALEEGQENNQTNNNSTDSLNDNNEEKEITQKEEAPVVIAEENNPEKEKKYYRTFSSVILLASALSVSSEIIAIVLSILMLYRYSSLVSLVVLCSLIFVIAVVHFSLSLFVVINFVVENKEMQLTEERKIKEEEKKSLLSESGNNSASTTTTTSTMNEIATNYHTVNQ